MAALLERHTPLHDRNQIHPVAQLLQFLVRDARQMSRRQGHLPCGIALYSPNRATITLKQWPQTRTSCRSGYAPSFDKALFTASLTRLPSARPAIFGINAFITAPMSLGPRAPDAVTESCTSAESSASVN